MCFIVFFQIYFVDRGDEMTSKIDGKVMIGGKSLTVSGYESEEYFQQIATYINTKISEYGEIESFQRQPHDMQNVLMQINIADDYFKAKKKIAMMEYELEAKEKEVYDLKHELVSIQLKLEEALNGPASSAATLASPTTRTRKTVDK